MSQPVRGASTSSPHSSPLALAGGRLTRDTLIYGLGNLAVGPFSLISVAVLTRLLAPTVYGRLGVLLVFAGFLTVLYNTGSLHGTFMWVYGQSDEGEVADDMDGGRAIASTPRRAMGTGVVLTLLIVSAGSTIIFVAAAPLARLLLHSSGYASSVRWAAACAATGALWRLTVNVFRMERRPVSFSVLNSTRPLFVVAGSLPLVALGLGVNGALAGISLGTLAASVVCVLLARHSYAFAFSLPDARRIVRLGARVVVPVSCLYFLHSADILLLSRFASPHELGLYRVASRFGALPSYFASSMLMAWAPLEAGLLFRSLFKECGEHETRSLLLSHYLIAGTTLVLLLDIGANGLMLIAGPSYRSAAPLIPAVGAMFVIYGLFVVLVRAMRTQRTMLLYGLGSLIAVVLDVGFSVLLIPWIGAYGAPAAALIGLAVACVLYVAVVSRIEERRFPFEWNRLSALAVAAGAAAAIQLTLGAIWPSGHLVALALAVIAYCGLLVKLGALPTEEVRRLGRLLVAVMRNRIGSIDPAERLGALSAQERRLLAELERDRTPALLIATRERRSQRAVVTDYVATLRKLCRASPSDGELEERIGAYLLSSEPHAQRDRLGRGLVQDGANPADLLLLDEAVQKLRALSPTQWARWATDNETSTRYGAERIRAVLADMPPASRRAAIAVLRDGRAAVHAAGDAGLAPELIAARVVRLLRRIGDLGRGEPFDAQLGLALLGPAPAPRATDDARAIGMVYDRLRAMRKRQWRGVTAMLETGALAVRDGVLLPSARSDSPPLDSPPSDTPRRSPIERLSPAVPLAAGLLLCGVGLMVLSRHLSFYADEWEFIINRRGWNPGAFLRPHNEHLMLVPIAIFKMLFVTVGLRHSWPYRLVLIAVHLLCVGLIYAFAARRAGRWPALALAALILIPGAAFEDLVYPINVGFIGSATAGVGALLCLDRRTRGGDAGASALLGVSLASTSLGIPFALGVLVELVIHREHRRRAWVALLPLALYGLWYLHWGSAAHSEVTLSNLPAVPSYDAEAASYGLAGIVNLSLAYGQIALVAAVAWLLVRFWRGQRMPAWGIAGLVGAIAFWSLAALGRAQLDSPGSSRYVYPSIVFILVIAAAHMRRPPRVTLRAGALVAVGLAAMFLGNLRPLINYVDYRTRYDRTYDATLGAELIAGLPNDPYVQATDQLGSPALSDRQILALGSEDRIAADELLQKIEKPKHRLTRVSTSTVRALARTPALEGEQGMAIATVPAFGTAKCLRLRPLAAGGSAEIAVAPGAGLYLSMYSGGEVGIQLRRLSDAFTMTPVHGFAHRKGPAVIWFPVDRSRLPWYVQLTPTARVEVCLV